MLDDGRRPKFVRQLLENLVAMASNVVFKAVVMVGKAAITATDIIAAIKPYSIAVAPDLSTVKRTNNVFIRGPL